MIDAGTMGSCKTNSFLKKDAGLFSASFFSLPNNYYSCIKKFITVSFFKSSKTFNGRKLYSVC